MHGLRDLRVIDLSTGIAGGYATKLFCDAGADVVKVEPPGGDPLRRFTASGAHGIEVLSQASLGGKERVVIVQVAGQNERLLLGVAGGQVTLLQTLPPDSGFDRPVAAASTPQPPRFGDLLRRSLGK